MPQKKVISFLTVWALAGELGFMIAIPVVVFVLLGIKVDTYFGTTPLFILVGMVVAALVSSIGVRRKIKEVSP